tara:strand:+ start:130 stop:591 length:462 start_codon:yes stop_codon:yes gene_type:complete
MKRFGSKVLIAGLLAGTTLFSGCYGSFALTKKVHSWNGEVSENKFVQWLVFLGLNVVQVYSIAIAVDALVANTIEFWTGDNPAAGVATRVEKNEDGTATIYRGDEVFTAVPVANDKVEIYKDGQRVGVAATTEDGSFVVTDERGVVRLNTKKL